MNYLGLNALKAKFTSAKLDIVGVPCNQFMLQEPGTNEELLNTIKYVRPGDGYEPAFRLTKKAKVNGATPLALFGFLKGTCAAPSVLLGSRSSFHWDTINRNDIAWNFERFIVDVEGVPRYRVPPSVDPEKLEEFIQILLDEAENSGY